MMSERARARRRLSPITCAIGPNGSGKTLSLVHDTLPSLDAGRPVLSTVRLLDWRHPRPCEDPSCSWPGHPEHGAAHPCWVPFVSWEQMLDRTDCDVLMDEITGVAGARDTSALPSIVGDALKRQRAAERVVRWSAPSWVDGDVQLRRVTQSVTVCRGFLRRRMPERLWPSYRGFLWKTYDVRSISEEQVEQLAGIRTKQHTTGKVRPVVREVAWDLVDAQAAYDTFGMVLRVGTAVESGRCMTCGKRLKVAYCEGHDDDHEHDGGPASARASRSRARQLPTAAAVGRRALPVVG